VIITVSRRKGTDSDAISGGFTSSCPYLTTGSGLQKGHGPENSAEGNGWSPEGLAGLGRSIRAGIGAWPVAGELPDTAPNGLEGYPAAPARASAVPVPSVERVLSKRFWSAQPCRFEAQGWR